MKKVPIIPADHWFMRNSLVILKDPLAFFIKMFAEYGDIYDVNSNFFTIYVVANPAYIQEIMVSNKKDYAKSDDYKILKYSLGNGLLTSEGDFWKKQRRIAQPAFYRDSMKLLLDTMIASTQATIQTWKSKKQVQLTDEMHFLTLDIVTKCLFGTTLESDYSKIQESITIGNEYLAEKIMKPFTPPIWLPTAKTKRYKKSRKYSSDVILDIIKKREKDSTEHHDLLSMLMNAQDQDTGEKMSPQQLKDESMTIFVAGHETTANALSWTFYLLVQHPDKLQLLLDEIETVLQGEVPNFQSLKELSYTQMVIEEAMRIYPPAWSIGRKVAQDTTLDGYPLKKDIRLILDVYTLHRHPDYWENPNNFEPERFSPERKKQRHKYAYIPFGAGQRMCIGNNFALMEMKVVLVLLLQHFELKLAKNAPEVVPEPLITLRPKNGILMDIAPR
ncbi:cytochrome P450 [Aureispira anguillae]|uniref:Cytochrome P450 n=1 Tax=Aureispira anguillae TaxID=2864201 RepID=A0A915YDU2_9BACT|nr:cytochrome P450 [Aureispira anguillae]BDS11264.1 cytochrome P450 [Aureispira anguillae]